MGYWTKAKEESQSGQGTLIPEGIAQVQITNFFHGKKDGTKFVSSKGDPQVLIVYADADGAEATQMLTLSKKAQWTLINLLEACGHDMDALDAAGVKDLKDFEEAETCRQWLDGRKLFAEVSHSTNERSGKVYANVDPIAPANVSPAIAKRERERWDATEGGGETQAVGAAVGDASAHFKPEEIPFAWRPLD